MERLEGRLQTWSPLLYGFIIISSDIFFLHFSEIAEGIEKATIGAKVTYDVAPPLAGKRHRRAVNAIVGGAN
jgi:hypothetical protein